MIDYDNCNVVLLIGTLLFQTLRFMDYLPQSHRVGNPVVEVTLFNLLLLLLLLLVCFQVSMMKKKMESFLSTKLFITLSADLAERPTTD